MSLYPRMTHAVLQRCSVAKGALAQEMITAFFWLTELAIVAIGKCREVTIHRIGTCTDLAALDRLSSEELFKTQHKC